MGWNCNWNSERDPLAAGTGCNCNWNSRRDPLRAGMGWNCNWNFGRASLGAGMGWNCNWKSSWRRGSGGGMKSDGGRLLLRVKVGWVGTAVAVAMMARATGVAVTVMAVAKGGMA